MGSTIRSTVERETSWKIRHKPISMLFNTDGAPLFQSSGISLWPVFLAINEIPPTERLALNLVTCTLSA